MTSLEKIERIYLIGLMGAGKSTVGRVLAAVLDWQFIDLDRDIAKICGKTINDIFEQEGEAGFRAYETARLRETGQRTRIVVACGGGVITETQNLEFSHRQTTVWLELSPAEAAVRLEHSDNRPLLAECQDTVLTLDEILLERRAAYQQAAGIRINTGGLAPEVVASQILQELHHLND